MGELNVIVLLNIKVCPIPIPMPGTMGSAEVTEKISLRKNFKRKINENMYFFFMIHGSVRTRIAKKGGRHIFSHFGEIKPSPDPPTRVPGGARVNVVNGSSVFDKCWRRIS